MSNQLTADVSDDELLAAAKRAFPRYRYALETFHVFGNPGECEVRLHTCVTDRWKIVARARSRVALLLHLNALPTRRMES